ncbi:hypothetical protein LCGC14_1200920 [marine sediment metagenome]|uniref:Uncharacterized protein n=1 Tax=marine sediment metagenome TaxID=412755 RepID=A0A0F9M499_9ZZZZ
MHTVLPYPRSWETGWLVDNKDVPLPLIYFGKKYLVIPGHVGSRHDADTHYIGSGQLMMLYNVNPKDCVIKREHERLGLLPDHLIVLDPSFGGKYDATKNPRF